MIASSSNALTAVTCSATIPSILGLLVSLMKASFLSFRLPRRATTPSVRAPGPGGSRARFGFDPPLRGGPILRVRTRVTIGDFSRASHLSVKTLRHYHEVGLLEPSEVDPHNGYRYYSEEQIPLAQVIRRLR